MNVLFITRNYPPVVCGVGDYTSKLASEFILNKNTIHVLTGKEATVDAGDNNIFIHTEISKWSVCAVPRIMRKCKAIDPDIISMQYVPYSFSNKGVPFWFILLYILFKIKGYKVVTTFHEVGIRYTENNIKRKITATAQFFIARILSILSVKNITSIDLYVQYLKKYTTEVYKIPIGSNIMPSGASTLELESLRNQVAQEHEFIISSFGTRVSDVILHTLAALKREKYPIKLLLLGNLPKASQEQFKQVAQALHISEDIYITGYLEERALYNHLKISSLFVMAEFVSSKGEGGIAAKSGALAAAFATGLPILGTKGDTTDDVFKHNANIFLMNEYSVSETTKRIREIMNNKQQLDFVSQQAQSTFEEYFSWANIYKKYIDVFNTSLKK